jgi:hypothetical protein
VSINSNYLNPVKIPVNDKPLSDRMTVIINVVHEHFPDSPVSISNVYSYLTNTNEQRFVRNVEIPDDTWVPLDIGWFDKLPSGIVVIRNMFGIDQRRSLSEEAIRNITDHYVMLKMDVDSKGIIIRPNILQVLEPEDIKSVRLKSANGRIPVKIVIHPR